VRNSSSAARATPTAIAATIGRVLSKVSMTPAKPFFPDNGTHSWAYWGRFSLVGAWSLKPYPG